MSEQFDSLGEKTKLVDISLRYTDGDIEKAKAMASGTYLDSNVIKAKFYNSDSNESGLFLSFFNSVHDYISNVSSVINSDNSIFERVRIFDDWKSLYNNINAYRSGDDVVDYPNFNDALMDLFVSKDIFPYVSGKDISAASVIVTEGLKTIFGSSKIQCQIEIDTTSSLAMDIAGVMIDVPGGTGEDIGTAMKVPVETTIEDERISKIENEADYIVEGKVIVAPVKGKNINDIVVGEKIKVLLTGDDVITQKVIAAMNASDETGGRYPINGRVKAKIPMEKSGYIIYTLVAKGILAKIIEEENVKILVDKPIEEMVTEKKGDNKLLFIMAIVVGLIIIAGIVLLALL
ncbi:MAG: hypothetical protein JXA20_04575 [Spirochaetes bacterium]|nr:hypothetical protein [Spirochaetota bacterium]